MTQRSVVPIEREKILQAAQKLVDKKRFDKAIVELRRVVAADPSDVRTLLRIGDLHLKLEQFAEAIGTYEQVGDFYYREGLSVKAIAVYKQIRGIVRRHAPHLESRYGHIVPRLAEIYTQLGLTSDALSAYDEVATRLRAEGRERDALDIFRKVVELDPQNPIAHLRVADSRARLGDIDKAVERFGEAARIMVGLGRLDDALKVLERLLEYRQDPRFARMAADIYLRRANPNDGMAALKKLQLAFKSNPRDLETLKMLALAFDTIDQPKKAIEVLKESARIAKDAGDRASLDELLEALRARVPEDTLVVKLDQWRLAQAVEAARGYPAYEADPTGESDIVVEESIEAIEEVFELDEDGTPVGEVATRDSLLGQEGAGEDSAVRRLLNEAERQRNVGQLEHAIRLLRDGLRNLGGSGTLRHKLSDLLLEAGDTAGAITEKLILAQELANSGSVEPALELLDEVLLLQPGQPDAIQMRGNLGFPFEEASYEDLSLDQPLQSYDVESGGVAEALFRTRYHSVPAFPTLDDPFSSDHAPTSASLPPPMAQRRSLPPASLDEEALDKAETLTEQGRFDEARALLHAQLHALPNHPLILERLADIDAVAAHASTSHSGNFPVPSVAPGTIAEGYGDAAEPRGAEGVPASYQQAARQSGEQWSSEVDSLLDQVREGVRNQVAESDAATHYDLGVAYYEMGLHNDAISELTLAARDPARECVCLSLIATIQLGAGEYDPALDALHRALQAAYKTREQELALAYEIANTYELKMMPEQALEYFDWLWKVEPSYDDPRGNVAERIHHLRTESGAQRRPQPPVAPDTGDLNNAFDDMFEEG